MGRGTKEQTSSSLRKVIKLPHLVLQQSQKRSSSSRHAALKLQLPQVPFQSKLTALRFKPEMWAKVAEELAVPWRAAEAMHWQLGENDMARRAGVVPFSLSAGTDSASGQRPSNLPPRGPAHSHSHSHGSAPSYAGPSYESGPHAPGPRTMHTRSTGPTRSIAARRDSTPRSVPPPAPADSLTLAGIRSPIMGGLSHGSNGHGRGAVSGGPMLPSVMEMTTRPSPYSTPGAYSVTSSMGGSYPSPGPSLPALGYREGARSLPSVPEEQQQGSRSPEIGREGLRRRQYE